MSLGNRGVGGNRGSYRKSKVPSSERTGVGGYTGDSKFASKQFLSAFVSDTSAAATTSQDVDGHRDITGGADGRIPPMPSPSSSLNDTVGLLHLPAEIHTNLILPFLDPLDLLAYSRTCKRFQKYADGQQLW